MGFFVSSKCFLRRKRNVCCICRAWLNIQNLENRVLAQLMFSKENFGEFWLTRFSSEQYLRNNKAKASSYARWRYVNVAVCRRNAARVRIGRKFAVHGHKVDNIQGLLGIWRNDMLLERVDLRDEEIVLELRFQIKWMTNNQTICSRQRALWLLQIVVTKFITGKWLKVEKLEKMCSITTLNDNETNSH